MAGLAETVRKTREEKGLSQHALARRADVADSTIAKLETRRGGTPRPKTIRKLAAALGVPVRELVGDESSEFVEELLAGEPTPLEDVAPEDAAGLRATAQTGEARAWFGGELPEVPQEVAVAIAGLVVENQRLRQRVRELEESRS